MSVTISFTASTDSDIASVKVWEATSSSGEYSAVYTASITTSTTYVTYSAGLTTNWYRLSFVDLYGNESGLSAAVYGGGDVWYNYMTPIFRTQTDDWGTTQRLTDLLIKKRLVVAAHELQTMGALDSLFDYSYTFSFDTGDGSGWNISPDPVYGSKDNNFLNLWIMKALCNDSRSSLISGASNGIKIKDGDSSIDTTASFGGYKELLSNENGPCSRFNSAYNQLIYSKKNGDKLIYGNFGSDFKNRVGIIDNYGTVDRSDF